MMLEIEISSNWVIAYGERLKSCGEVYAKASEHLGTNIEGGQRANDELGRPVR
jgi:hypothetical protein